jgi:hypothetical protein
VNVAAMPILYTIDLQGGRAACGGSLNGKHRKPHLASSAAVAEPEPGPAVPPPPPALLLDSPVPPRSAVPVPLALPAVPPKVPVPKESSLNSKGTMGDGGGAKTK